MSPGHFDLQVEFHDGLFTFFDHIYDLDDLRGNFTELERYDYRIPSYVQSTCGGLLAERAGATAGDPRYSTPRALMASTRP